MLKKIAISALAILAIILLMATMQPDSFSVRRSVTVNAAPDKIVPLLADFHNWPRWSPWEKLDPAMQRTFSGAQSGEGAVYSWKGNSDVGAGRMEILEVVPAQKVAIKLDFSEPMESSSITNFTLQPQGTATTVTWNMSGPMPFLSKVMSVFASMDKMIGKDFEKGLSQLKAEAEK
jgi:uncharacterized protein YndB with AHSA1/START domain